jgi:hypothetical protein
VLFNIVVIFIGFAHPALVGYGGWAGQLMSVSVIIIVGLLSCFYARYPQRGVPGRALWREPLDNSRVTAAQAGIQAPEGSQ